MGEFTRTNDTPGKTFLWAVQDIVTNTNFTIALLTGITGHLVFEFLRKKLF